MTVTDPGSRLWQPGVDAPLFPGELIAGPDGLATLDSQVAAQVRAYLAAVVAARGFPLHITVAWNALHYGYDLTTGGYSETLLNAAAFPTLDPDTLESTPTGAMVLLPAGTPVWAEVVHTELDDTSFDMDGDLPPSRSGAPADDRTRLRAVLDAAAFGPLLPEQHATLARLRRKGVLDRFEHLLATHAPTDAVSATNPIGAYAAWLVTDLARLGGGPVPAALDSSDPVLIEAAVRMSLDALLMLMADAPGVQVVGEYLTSADLIDGSAPVLPAEDVTDLLTRVCRVQRWRTRYTSAGVALRDMPADRQIHGSRYLSALVQVNNALRTRATDRDSDARVVTLRLDDAGRGGGVWRAAGNALFDWADGTHPLIPLGLGHEGPDDTTQEPAQGQSDEPQIGASPGATDGLTGDGDDQRPSPRDTVVQLDAQPDEPEPNQPASSVGNGLIGPLDVTASHVTFTVALRTRHLADGALPIPAELTEHLSDAPGPLAVRIGHPGGTLEPNETFHEPVTRRADPHQVTGITWPLAFYPGLLLSVTLTVGGRILDVTTELLPDPVVLGTHTLTYATDLAILAAYCGLTDATPEQVAAAAGEYAPVGVGADGHGLDGDPAADPGSSADPFEEQCGTGGPECDDPYADTDLSSAGNRAYLALLLRTLLRTVPAGDDGTRTFTASALVATAFAGLPPPADALGRAHRMLDAHASRGRLLRLPGTRRFVGAERGFVDDPHSYVWWPPGQAAPLRRLPTRGVGPHRAHWVPMSLRKLPSGWSPSPEKVAAWPALRANLGDAYLPWDLPPGHTWVEAHERGADPGWQSGAVRT